jgi:hypothetical protein
MVLFETFRVEPISSRGLALVALGGRQALACVRQGFGTDVTTTGQVASPEKVAITTSLPFNL